VVIDFIQNVLRYEWQRVCDVAQAMFANVTSDVQDENENTVNFSKLSMV
jgi:hypothetical protein